MKFLGKNKYTMAVFFCVFSIALLGSSVLAKGEKFKYEDIIRLERVVNKIGEFYVEEVESEKLVEAAIDGLRDVLDPHTAYFSEKDYDNLKISTEGAFGGLGITIAIRDRVLTIISPLVGTPAFRMGLQAGDKIMEIDNESTKGITVDKAVEKLRGKPGTPVRIKIFREGLTEMLEYTVIREIIQIQSVPFAGLIQDSIGYVKITQFSKQTSQDLSEKLAMLKKQGMKSLILDLRNNPGGLLNQAIEVSELFLEKNQLVVYTKGRTQGQNKTYNSSIDPVLPKSTKIVVLVNQGSASASEIVSGAIQDHDRGIIMGEPTFGKGSVQTILPLDAEKYALKLTTAYYYTPSGRCINKPENAARASLDENGDFIEPDLKIGKDSTKFFKTDAGRKVYGGGGIEPDVESKPELYTRYVRELERKTMFFKYIVKNRPKIEKAEKIDLSFKFSPVALEEFRQFITADTSFASYKSASHLMLDEFTKTMQKEREAHGDTLPSAMNSQIDSIKSALEKQLVEKTKKEFDSNLDYVQYGLKRELLQSVLGDSASTLHQFSRDAQVKDAIAYLKDEKKYKQAITKSTAKIVKP